ncbi:MAG: hypothetical protein U5K43_00165 [Halofilum sp. (in: g-proteobacteria)]|nr:hypothetical protein [Halofilum sp. (in: g-proteobacteria)]
MLSGAGVPRRTIHVLTRTGKRRRTPSRLHPGEEIRVGLDPEGRLQRLEHVTAPDRRLVFDREGEDTFAAAVVEEPLQRRLEHARGVIDTSLFEAGAEAGLDNRLIMDLAGIFGWDIDFVLDIRRGDRFTVVYETCSRTASTCATATSSRPSSSTRDASTAPCATPPPTATPITTHRTAARCARPSCARP